MNKQVDAVRQLCHNRLQDGWMLLLFSGRVLCRGCKQGEISGRTLVVHGCWDIWLSLSPGSPVGWVSVVVVVVVSFRSPLAKREWLCCAWPCVCLDWWWLMSDVPLWSSLMAQVRCVFVRCLDRWTASDFWPPFWAAMHVTKSIFG